jgi:protein-S-isoprenylcysteine O-methyltransferase Ste14
MVSVVEGQLFALVTYAGLGTGVLYGRPSRTWVQSADAAPPGRQVESRVSEVLWLASLATIFAYPAGVLLSPSDVWGSPLTLRFPGDEIVPPVGLALILIGGGLVGWSFRSLGRFMTVSLQLTADQAIIRAGPYARVRHPIYTANMLLSLGIALAFLSLVLWLPVALVVLLARYRAKTEEVLFLASPRLGSDYAAYMAASGRFLPPCALRSRREM